MYDTISNFNRNNDVYVSEVKRHRNKITEDDSESNSQSFYYVYKVVNNMTADTFLIYSLDKDVLKSHIKQIVKQLTETDDDLQNAYSNIGIDIASNDETFGFDVFDKDDSGEIFIKGKPIKLIGVQSFRF